jgi:hypothetical protein
MNKLSSIDLYIDEQTEEISNMLIVIRNIISDTIPQAVECIKFNTPFFTYHGLFCYFYTKKNKVYLGICNGAQLEDHYGILQGNTTTVKNIIFNSIKDIRIEEIEFYLKQSAILRDMQASIKKTKKHKKIIR